MTDSEWKGQDHTPGWHFSLGGEARGPYTFAQLKNYVDEGVLEHGTLVWREGEMDWTPAAQVEGLITTPPPIPTANGSSAGATLRDVVIAKRLRPANGNEPAGIEGWLMLFAILLVLRVLTLAFAALAGLGEAIEPSRSRYDGEPPFLLIFSLIGLAVWVPTAAGFYRKREWVPKAVVWLTGLNALVYPIVSRWEQMADPALADWFAPALFALAVIGYWTASQRVANTFVTTPPDGSGGRLYKA